MNSPVGWGRRIHRQHSLQTDKTHLNENPVYDIKQSDGEAPVMLEFCEITSTFSLQSLPGPLWPGVVAPDRVLPMDKMELFNI